MVEATNNIFQFINAEMVIDRPLVKHAVDYDLLEKVVLIGQKNASSRYMYVTSLLQATDEWERQAASRTATYLHTVQFPRETDESSNHEVFFMKNTVPLVYVIWCLVFSVFSSVFTSIFCVGLITSSFLIPPWLNLVLCTSNIGMTATIIAAIWEWRRTVNGKAD